MVNGREHRTLILSDAHIPYQDPYAMGVALNVAARCKPDEIVYAGDMLDFYQISNYDKDPARSGRSSLQQEINAWVAWAHKMRAAVPEETRFHFIPGNHEDRLRRYLWRNPELADLRVLGLPNLLELNQLGIEYHDQEYVLIPKRLVVKHGRRIAKYSAFSAKAELELEKYQISTITGHTHRLGSHYARTRYGLKGAWENGCLCTLNPEYTVNPDWHHGCTLVTHWGSDSFYVQNVPFIGERKKMRAIIDGQIIGLYSSE